MRNINNEGFVAMITLLFFMSMTLIIIFSLSTVVLTTNKITKNSIDSVQSYYSGESGVEDGLLRVMKDYDYTAINSFSLGDNVQVSQNISQSGNTTTISSMAIYKNNKREIEAELIITTDDVSFHYGVQVGEGGLTMGPNSSIDGNLYSDGPVSGEGTITGDLIVATGMNLDGNGVWDTYNDDMIFGKDGEVTDIAMSFVPVSTGMLSQVSFYVKNSNPVHGDGTIRIVEDNAGSPSTTVLATATFLSSKIGSFYGWVNFGFSVPPDLTGGSIYWIIVDVNSSSNKYFSIGRAPENTNISKHNPDWSGGSWTTDVAGGYEYKAYIGGLATSVDGMIIEGDVHAYEIIDCTIDGDAYYQVISGSTIGGTSFPGSPDEPIASLPISDGNISDWKAEAEAYGDLPSSLCNITTDTIIEGGKLECPSGFNPDISVIVTLKGTLWVKGNFTLSNNVKFILDSGYGSNSGIIIVDDSGNEAIGGKIIIENNNVICGSQGLNVGEDGCRPSNETYILMLSTHSGTATNAIEVSNNADGAIFYAHNGTAHIKNNANLKEVTAYKLSLENNATVTYESGLASTSFSSGPGGGYEIENWNEIQ
ncbi:MAG: hypothetical protein KAI67_02910 [Candidatus Pacebacteria bacterium]|nr:hypothetical protein [Candidatus Paceibacterota bacterium]